jgi:hypothetical protein
MDHSEQLFKLQYKGFTFYSMNDSIDHLRIVCALKLIFIIQTADFR